MGYQSPSEAFKEIGMNKNLVIVESPTKTKTISKILGPKFKVVATKGHLRDLPKSQFGVDIKNQFQPKYINVRGKAKMINALKKDGDEADFIYLATDPDREGEAISWHLAYLLGQNEEKLKRVTFQEITPLGVKEGMDNPGSIDMNLVNAQQARRIMDRIVGYQISPILWKKVKNGLSAGRVQSVAVKLIVDREREIQAFVPEEYWSVHSLHNEEKIKFETEFVGLLKGKTVKKIKISNEKEADQIISSLGSDFFVHHLTQKEKKKLPYAPFTTSTLQQEASRKLGFNTSKTMMIAQRLYEGISLSQGGQVGLITYMRTDSTRMSKVFTSQASDFIRKNFGEEYATSGIRYGGMKANSQDAHEGIRPTDVFRTPSSIRDDLTEDQYKLYSLIWRRAVASQMKAAVSLSTSVDLLNGSSLFRVNGSESVFDGFSKIWPTAEKNLLLPPLKEGQVIRALKIDKRQHFTQPPARFSEASLVQILEKNGIGRPSTYASIIQSIKKRGYVHILKKQFLPTDLGFKVNDLLEKNFPDIVNVNFTAQMEERLDSIAEGDLSWQALLGDFYQVFAKEMEKAKEDNTTYKLPDPPTGEKCPECGHDLVYKSGRNGRFIGCSNFPACKFTKSIIKKTGVLCPKCGAEIVEKISKRGKVFYGCSAYPKCDYATWDKPTGDRCPICGDLFVHKKNRWENRIICANKDCINHDPPGSSGKGKKS